jgi:hypothetical protein
MQQLREKLLGEEVVFEQFQNATPQNTTPPAVQTDESPLTDISSNTLVSGGKVGSVKNIETPQPIATTSNPTFNTVNVTDPTTTRNNLQAARRATPAIVAATIPLAKITGGGTDGSLTVNAEGIVTAYIAPT